MWWLCVLPSPAVGTGFRGLPGWFVPVVVPVPLTPILPRLGPARPRTRGHGPHGAHQQGRTLPPAMAVFVIRIPPPLHPQGRLRPFGRSQPRRAFWPALPDIDVLLRAMSAAPAKVSLDHRPSPRRSPLAAGLHGRPGFGGPPQCPADRKRTAQTVRGSGPPHTVDPSPTAQRLPPVFGLPTTSAQPRLSSAPIHAAKQPRVHRLPERAKPGPLVPMRYPLRFDTKNGLGCDPNPLFFLVRPERFELPACGFEVRRSIRLSYGRVGVV